MQGVEKYYVFCAKGNFQNMILYNFLCGSLFICLNFFSLFLLELDPAVKPHSQQNKNDEEDEHSLPTVNRPRVPVRLHVNPTFQRFHIYYQYVY